MLLTADIETPDENAMLARGIERSNVMLVPHHGSGTSSGGGFLDAVQPDVAIIPVGYRNRYRHPKPEVLSAYEARRIRVLRTDRDGMVQVALPTMRITGYRQTHQRYWMDQPDSATTHRDE
jgi:competence protein ComEC